MSTNKTTGMPFNICKPFVSEDGSKIVVMDGNTEAHLGYYSTEAEAQQAIRLHENAGELLMQLGLLQQRTCARLCMEDPHEMRSKSHHPDCDEARNIIRKIKKG